MNRLSAILVLLLLGTLVKLSIAWSSSCYAFTKNHRSSTTTALYATKTKTTWDRRSFAAATAGAILSSSTLLTTTPAIVGAADDDATTVMATTSTPTPTTAEQNNNNKPIEEEEATATSTSPVGEIWARYNELLDEKPLLTKMLTSLTGFTVGDILAQKFIETNKSDDDGDDDAKQYDVMRTARLAAFGFLLHGTLGHYFYGSLDSNFPGTTASTVATKVAIDQTMANPAFMTIFFAYLNFAEGKTWETYVEKLKATGKRPSRQVGLYGYRHTPSTLPWFLQRLLYINTVQIAFNVFLSVLGNKQVEEEEEEEPVVIDETKETLVETSE